ncbi:hypothetical protein HYFRA_00001357 [Hymenoscyphus fraxineus]|uniref:Uncharacterized protein n=1 Tax=Hymenoscyphus fraxineus TaxID=746836 RepID=A0A9N9L4R6_9HELO|nr:hypothetical protein HYFRA_00001357 [Hymenoscyphus fraxineus]
MAKWHSLQELALKTKVKSRFDCLTSKTGHRAAQIIQQDSDEWCLSFGDDALFIFNNFHSGAVVTAPACFTSVAAIVFQSIVYPMALRRAGEGKQCHRVEQ